MSAEDNEYLLKALAGVFEGFAFMFVEEEDGEEDEDGGAFLGAAISYWGPDVTGEIEIVMPEGLCTELAVNILGTEEEELPEDAGASALAEVLNVSAGYLLAEKYGVEEVFNLSIPETREVAPEEWTRLSADERYSAFMVDESRLLARLTAPARQ